MIPGGVTSFGARVPIVVQQLRSASMRPPELDESVLMKALPQGRVQISPQPSQMLTGRGIRMNAVG
jgi:hypothetical protein